MGNRFISARAGKRTKDCQCCGVPIDNIALNVAQEKKDAPELAGERSLLSVPILGSASAGSPLEQEVAAWQEKVEDYTGKMPGDCFAVRVKGDSMQCAGENSIPNGALCICVSSRDWPASAFLGRIVCVRLEGEEHLVKQLVKSEGHYILKSFNPAYNPILIESPDAVIEGIVLLVINKTANFL